MHCRYIEVIGSAYQRGFAIGRECREGIFTMLESNEHAAREQDGLTLHDWLPNARTLLPYVQEHAPRTLEEMKGMAAGSGVQFEDILLLSCAYEKWFNYHAPDHCTGFAAMAGSTKDGRLLCGQNNDERFDHWAAGQKDLVVHHKNESGLETLIYTHPGIPAYMGMNSSGLCLLWMGIDNGERAPGLPTNILIREILRKETLESAVTYLKEVPRAVPNNFLLAHSTEGICNVECSSSYFRETYSDSHLIHANHILDKAMAKSDIKLKNPDNSTFTRHRAMDHLIKDYAGRINIQTAQKMLSDHTYYPLSICAHPHRKAPFSKTLASMVFNPAENCMHIAFGNGCEMSYITYSFS